MKKLLASVIMLASAVLFCGGCVLLAVGAYVWGRALSSLAQGHAHLAAAITADAQPPSSDEATPDANDQSEAVPSSLQRRAPDIQDDDSLIHAWEMEQDERLRTLAERQAARGDLTTDDNVGSADYKGAENGLYVHLGQL